MENIPMRKFDKPFEDNLIMKLSFEFALETIEYVELLESKRKFVVANQLLKSATSIGANVREAQNAESKLDFIHKFKIAAKEADETDFWLLLCQSSKSYPSCENLLEKSVYIQKTINKIISTSKKKLIN
ncbi:MAG: four helix bundle protein [Bacteroidota bacterium]